MSDKQGRWFCVANPVAGRGAVVRRRERIVAALRAAGISFEWRFTEAAGHAIQLTRQAIAAGHRRFLAIGGDGTGHEVVNGMLSQNEVQADQLLFTLMPVGTGNDWCRWYGLPHRLTHWVRRFQAGRVRWQDVGCIHFTSEGKAQMRYFINVAGLAYDGYVGKVAASRQWTRFSKLMYLWLVFRCLLSYRLPQARVLSDVHCVRGRFYSINAGICPYSGGGIRMVPHAEPDDGLLALTLAGEVGAWEVLRAVPLFYNGRIATHPAVTTAQVREVEVYPEGGSLIDVEADGEYLGVAPVRIEVVPRALRVWA